MASQLSRDNGACGKWLETLPTYEKFRMNPTPFRICLRHRMYLPTINFAHGSKCVCKDHPVLDQYGHHLASGCFIGGHGSNTHYSLVREINNILHYGGFATKKEEKNIFVDTLQNHILSSRMGIYIMNQLTFYIRLLIIVQLIRVYQQMPSLIIFLKV